LAVWPLPVVESRHYSRHVTTLIDMARRVSVSGRTWRRLGLAVAGIGIGIALAEILNAAWLVLPVVTGIGLWWTRE